MSHQPDFDCPAHATFAFGGLIGERIAANLRNWLLIAPLANPTMLTMFRDRDRRLDWSGEPADDGRPASERLLPWSGEFAGKYLISAVQGFRLTGNKRLLETLRQFVGDLIRHQAPDGYLGPFEFAQRMVGRNPEGGMLWDLWGQYHCMLGLYYWFKETGDTAALASCRRAADLFCRTFLDVEAKTWQFGRGDGSIISKRMRLLPGGLIAGHSHPNEARWRMEGETLVFVAQDGKVSTRFTWASLQNGRRQLRGTFEFDQRITHELNEVEPDLLKQVWRFARADGTLLSQPVRLLSNGRLQGREHPNEAHWGLVDDVLVFFTETFVATTRFDSVAMEDGVTVYRGTFLPDPSIRHVLSELYSPAPAMNYACAHIFALLYRETGEPRYRQMLREIEQAWETLGGNYVNGFQSGQAFFRSPQPRWESLHDVQAVAELYLLTDDGDQRERYRRALHQIWSSILERDRHNTGGFTSSEKATGNPYDPRPIETCGTVAWMALTLDMLRTSGDSRAADELEASTWNAALGAQSPDGRWWTYNTPMGGVPTDGMGPLMLPLPLGGRPPSFLGERRPAVYDLGFQDRPGSSYLSCCAANGPRGLGILSEWALMTAADGLVLNYYGPSQFTSRTLSGRMLRLVQDTTYPNDGRIRITLGLQFDERFALRLRIPGWSRSTTLSVNGAAESGLAPGSYRTLDRVWRSGDVIDLQLDMSPRVMIGGPRPSDADPQSGGGTAGRVSIYHGPLLLAYDPRFDTHDPARLPRIHPFSAPQHLPAPPDFPRPLVLLRFPASHGAITLCDFATAGGTSRQPRFEPPGSTTLWRFGRADGSTISERVRLLQGGIIAGHSHPNEARWGIEDDTLVFFARDGRVSTRFVWVSRENRRMTLRGAFEFDRSITHVLSELETEVTDNLWDFGRVGSDGRVVRISPRVRLLPGGAIAGHAHPNESTWTLEGDTLVFRAADGAPSTRFTSITAEHGRTVRSGQFLFDPSITHILRELDWNQARIWQFRRSTRLPISLRLLPDESIDGADHPNESQWRIEGDTLVFCLTDGTVTTRFTDVFADRRIADRNDLILGFSGARDVERRMFRRGAFVPDPGITHELREWNIDVGWSAGVPYLSWIPAPLEETSAGSLDSMK
jgi:DUF1680 family protein